MWRSWCLLLLVLAGPTHADRARVQIRTADGVRLPGHRYETASAPPVILLHGLASNLYSLDLPGHSLARHLARFDDAGVDAGLHASARVADGLARLNAQRGEAFADGLPGGLGRLTDWGGAWARRAQSGQTHHYYSGIVIGVVLILSLLVIGGLL